MTETGPDPGDGAVPRSGRRLVLGALALILTAGLIGFEAWPLTAWRLFSLSRRDRQTVWVLHATAPDDPERVVDLEELPLRYRHAAWPMAELRGASEARREDVCQALLQPAMEVVPGLTELRIVRDRQRLVEDDGDWVITHDPEIVHACGAGDR
ncbi:MAG: hypothetical protein ACLGI8_16020 [Acidimicrobiia bacterium]